MKRFHRNVRAMQAALYERPEIFKSIRVHAAIHVFDGMVDYLMVVVAVHPDIGLERICVESSTSLDLFPNERLHVVLAALLDDLCSDSTAPLHESDHYRLVVVYAASEFSLARLVHVSRLATDEGFVYLNFAVRTAPQFRSKEFILDSKPKALQHEPCRLLRNAKGAVNLHAGNAILAVDQHPKSGHPLVKSEGRILENRSQFQGELLLALVAEPDAARLDERMLGVAATRTNHVPVRPAQFLGKLKGAVRIREVNDGFLKCFGAVHV